MFGHRCQLVGPVYFAANSMENVVKDNLHTVLIIGDPSRLEDQGGCRGPMPFWK